MSTNIYKMLPRNKINKNYNNKIKNFKNKLTTDFEYNLLTICENHLVKPINFINCLLVDEFGKTTEVVINSTFEILVNMRASVIVLKYTSLNKNDNDIYDLYQIAYNKKIREEYNRENKEYQILKNNGLINDNEENDDILEENDDILEENNKNENEENDVLLEENNQEEVEKKKHQEGNSLRKQSKRNKYHNNFINALRKRFKNNISFLNEYKYVEMNKKLNIQFVIEHSEVYTIIQNDIKYLLIVGDLNLKREVLKNIDSSYNTDKMTSNIDQKTNSDS